MIKRIFDLLVAIPGLLFFSPLFLIIACAIKLDSVGPVFYKAARIGLHGKPFKMYKFRSMVIEAEMKGGSSTAENDVRITRVGRYLRKYVLDELPQLINVIRGEMSLVGPRPEVQEYTDLYTENEKVIFSVLPGMTDYASVKFINLNRILSEGDNPDEDYKNIVRPEKNRLRMEYAVNHTFWVDIKILYYTFLRIVTDKWNIKI